MKARIFAFLRAALSISLIGFLLYMRRDSLPEIGKAIVSMGGHYFLLGAAVFFAGTAALAYRLNILFSAQRIFFKYRYTLYLTLIGNFFNNFLPTSIGGDIVKAYCASKKTGETLRSFASVIMDRILGMLTLFILAGTSLALCYNEVRDKNLALPVIFILAALVTFFVLFLTGILEKLMRPFGRIAALSMIREKMREAFSTASAFKDKKLELAKALAVSIAAQIVFFSIIYIFSKGLGITVSMRIIFIFMPLVSAASMLPSINGLGIRENAMYFLYGPYIGHKNAFILSLLWLCMLLVVSAIGGVSYLFGREKGGAGCPRSL